MRRALAVACLLAGSTCSRSLTVPDAPPAPAPGSISGRVVVAQPGRTTVLPAIGADIILLDTGQSVRAAPSGHFRLEGITRTTGRLLFRYDSNTDGRYDRQKTLGLEMLAAGPGRDISMGDVLLSENARVTGKVLRADVNDPLGHAGTLVFVPEGPFTTLTSADGSFAFSELPEGTLSLAFFRADYVPAGYSPVNLSAGEDKTLQPVRLERLPSGTADPARVRGRVVLQPLGSLNLVRVALVAVDGARLTTTVDAEGRFSLMPLPNLYVLEVECPGYSTARINNLLAQPGERDVGDIVLLAGSDPGVMGGAGGGGGGAAGGSAGGEAGGSAGGAAGGAAGGEAGGEAGGSAGGAAGGAPAVPPVAVLPLSSAVRTGDPSARLDGQRSYDPLDAGPLIYHWVEESDAGIVLSINDSVLASMPTFQAPASTTTLRFALTVDSQSGQTSAPARTMVEVRPPPIARIEPVTLTMRPGQQALLSAAGSTDPNSLPLTFTWSLVAGAGMLSAPGGTQVTFTAAMTTGGARVRLVATNGILTSEPVELPIVINAMGSSVAQVTVTPPQVVNFGDPVSIFADAGSTNFGEGFSYTWTRTAGPAVTLNGATTSALGFIAPLTGASFTFTVSAVGDAGAVGNAQAFVVVEDNQAPFITSSDPVDSPGAPGGWYSLWAVFNEPLDPLTVTSATVKLLQGTTELPASVVYEGGARRVRLHPGVPLVPGAQYILRIGAVADVSGRHNAFAGRDLVFNARSPRFTLVMRPGASLSPQYPGILETTADETLLSYWFRGQLGTSGANNIRYESDGTFTNNSNAGASVPYLENTGRRSIVVNDTPFNFYSDRGHFSFRTGSWALGSEGSSVSACTDGTRLVGIGENNGPELLTWSNPAQPPLVLFADVRDSGFGWDGGEQGYSCAVSGNRQFMAYPARETGRPLLAYYNPGDGGWSQPTATLPLTDQVGLSRSAFIGGRPVVCYTRTASGQQLWCSLWTGSAWVHAADVGPGSVSMLDLHGRGDYAFLSFVAGAQSRVTLLTSPPGSSTLTATPLNGRTGALSWNYNPACANTQLEGFAGHDSFLMVMEEVCNGVSGYLLYFTRVE